MTRAKKSWVGLHMLTRASVWWPFRLCLVALFVVLSSWEEREPKACSSVSGLLMNPIWVFCPVWVFLALWFDLQRSFHVYTNCNQSCTCNTNWSTTFFFGCSKFNQSALTIAFNRFNQLRFWFGSMVTSWSWNPRMTNVMKSKRSYWKSYVCKGLIGYRTGCNPLMILTGASDSQLQNRSAKEIGESDGDFVYHWRRK